MANATHFQILKQGVKIWNEWRKRNPHLTPDLGGFDLSEAVPSLAGADLSSCGLWGVDLRYADLSNANLANAQIEDACLQNAILFNASLSCALVGNTNLEGADLSGADLVGADMEVSNLKNSILIGAILDRANLRSTDFRGAILKGCRLNDATLCGAYLTGSDLSESELCGANFSDARIGNANFDSALLSKTIFAGVDLTTAIGLGKCNHDGPSVVDDSTFQSSEGVPLEFWVGCRVSDIQIRSRFKNRDETDSYDSCFISYSNEDKQFVDLLLKDLENKGVDCWFAPEEMKMGDGIVSTLKKAIDDYDRLILVLSEQSIRSPWVSLEIETALEIEGRDKRAILIPIQLDDTIDDAEIQWVDRVKERHIGDFTSWLRIEAYQASFKHLLRDLRRKEQCN